MKFKSISFDKLPLSDIFRSYTRQSDLLKPFYQSHPFNDGEVRKRAEEFRFRGNRDKSVRALLRFNKQFDAPAVTLGQIEKLKNPASLAVVTGQQLSLYGGPLFTIYKTITAVIYARRWEILLDRPVIPVFWLADEDHDYREAGEIGLLNNDSWCSLQLENGQHNLPVGREKLGPEFNSLEQKLFELLPESDFTPEIREQLKTFYREGTTFRDAFARWFLHIFSGQGVVLAGSDDSGIKSLIAEPMIAAAEHHESFTKHLDEQSARLEENGFHRQALVQNSNIFYLDPEHGRQKLDMKGGQWKTRNGVAWSSSELVREIRNRPGFFSPNVFLRPLMQDLLIPTLAYVSGPGELSYYAQMKRAYEWMGQDMPMLLPRFSMTLKEPAIERIGKKLPFDFHEYARRIEDLETLYLERTGASDIENLFSSWTAGIEKVTAENMKWIEEIDPTLKASADKAGVLAQKEVSKVKAKTYRAIKKQEKIQLNRIHRIRENLFPGGELQERQVAFIYYLNKYGPDIWDRLGETLKDEIPDSHKIVYL